MYNICNGKLAPDTVNVQNALAIESEQSRQFSALLSSEFHKTIKKKVKTMELLKKAVTVKGGYLRRRDAVQSAVSRRAAAQH